MVVMPGLIDSSTSSFDFGNINFDEYSDNNDSVVHKTDKYLELLTDSNLEELVSYNIKLLSDKTKQIGITTLEYHSSIGLAINKQLNILELLDRCSRSINTSLIRSLSISKSVLETSEDIELLDRLKNNTGNRSLFNRAIIKDYERNSEKNNDFLNSLLKDKININLSAKFISNIDSSRLSNETGSITIYEKFKSSTLDNILKTNLVPIIGTSNSLANGEKFVSGRKILDAGGSLAISTGYNALSAPIGDLLLTSSILKSFEKLTDSEIFAGITFRAAAALNLFDRGKIRKGYKADFIGFPCSDYREILFKMGSLKPRKVWIDGQLVK